MKNKLNNLSDAEILRQKAEEQLKNMQSGVIPETTEADALKVSHELAVHQIELELQNSELSLAKEELVIQNEEKEKRSQELIIANRELIFQNNEKEKRAAELIIANKELVFQNSEKEKRAAELIIANKELVFQNSEKEKRAAEVIIINKELEQALQVNSDKNRFISILAHDLRGPFTVLLGYSELLLEKIPHLSINEIECRAGRNASG